MKNQDGPEDEAKRQNDDVNKTDGVPGLDEDATEKVPVLRAWLQQEEPKVCQEGCRAEKSWRVDILDRTEDRQSWKKRVLQIWWNPTFLRCWPYLSVF